MFAVIVLICIVMNMYIFTLEKLVINSMEYEGQLIQYKTSNYFIK
jgi:hypothetical protein